MPELVFVGALVLVGEKIYWSFSICRFPFPDPPGNPERFKIRITRASMAHFSFSDCLTTRSM